jgi:Helix-turn-helix domain
MKHWIGLQCKVWERYARTQQDHRTSLGGEMSEPAAARPTIEQVRAWPASVDIEDAALALGVSRSALYVAVRDGTCPAQVIRVGRRMKVLTHSLVEVLEGRVQPA